MIEWWFACSSLAHTMTAYNSLGVCVCLGRFCRFFRSSCRKHTRVLWRLALVER
jgi:hypothetical protein